MDKIDYKKLALKWAPIHYQYIVIESDETNEDVTTKTKRDLIVPINLDGYTNTCKCNYRKDEHNSLDSVSLNFYEKNSTKKP